MKHKRIFIFLVVSFTLPAYATFIKKPFMMESIALYLFKSVVWLTIFAGVYHFFLRNERYFQLNRLFLLTGLSGALLFPLITMRYVVTVPMVKGTTLVEGATMMGVEQSGNTLPIWQSVLWDGVYRRRILLFYSISCSILPYLPNHPSIQP
jgi:hypothetical protein